MSKIFYDEYIDLGDLHIHLNSVFQDESEKEDLWKLVDEFIHLKMVEIILDNLGQDLHEEFLQLYSERPYDEGIVSFLNENMAINFPLLIENEIEYLKNELINHFGIQEEDFVPKRKEK